MRFKLPSLKQPTTRRGLVAMLTLIASFAPTEYRQQIVEAGWFIYSCMLIWTDEDSHERSSPKS